jgi:hypothetical protein
MGWIHCIRNKDSNTFGLFYSGEPEKISRWDIPHNTVTIRCEGISCMHYRDTVRGQSGSQLLSMFSKKGRINWIMSHERSLRVVKTDASLTDV